MFLGSKSPFKKSTYNKNIYYILYSNVTKLQLLQLHFFNQYFSAN